MKKDDKINELQNEIFKLKSELFKMQSKLDKAIKALEFVDDQVGCNCDDDISNSQRVATKTLEEIRGENE